MKLADLSPELRERICAMRYDRIVEKHEGPARWSWYIDDAEFMEFNGHWVLLPIGTDQIPNITLLRFIPSADGRVLTLFLQDTTYCNDPDDYRYCAGYLAACDQFPDNDFYVCTVYHEWFIVENEGLA